MRYEYRTENTCSQLISFDIEGNVITNIEFYGGCNGNLKAVSEVVRCQISLCLWQYTVCRSVLPLLRFNGFRTYLLFI